MAAPALAPRTTRSSGEAAAQKPGDHGLLALDWWNGNRSVLVDANLSGLLVGMTLATRAPDIYRALIESTAYGTRLIVENFERCGVPVRELVIAGGLQKNQLLMQIYADVTGRPLSLVDSEQGPALGAPCTRRSPRAGLPHDRGRGRAHGPHPPQRLHAESGGRAGLRRALRRLRRAARLLRPRRQRRHEAPGGRWRPRSRSRSLDAPRRALASLHLELPRNGLVTWTSGNISARDFRRTRC